MNLNKFFKILIEQPQQQAFPASAGTMPVASAAPAAAPAPVAQPAELPPEPPPPGAKIPKEAKPGAGAFSPDQQKQINTMIDKRVEAYLKKQVAGEL